MKLVFASNNHNKVIEIRQVLPAEIEILTLYDIGCTEDIPETAHTIEGNAILKANYVTQNYGLDCFADDSGLEIDALNGEPGVISARYAGEHRNANDNIQKVLNNLHGIEKRAAQFKTVIALNIGGDQHLFTGIIHGDITDTRSGTGGFGYDSIFKPQGNSKTFAEISLAEKSQISHRGIAIAQLVDFLNRS